MKRTALFITTLFCLAWLPATATAATFKVVVHESNPIDKMTPAELADYLLKNKTRWSNGRAVTPVDQSEKNPVRELVSKSVLRKEVSWVKSYWQRMIFSGRATPPAELASDAEVISFVSANQEAIGYVSEAAAIKGAVKIVRLDE